MLNQDLHKNDAYKLGDQKKITAWLDLRNEAAHGHYDSYTQSEVEIMLDGVHDFLNRVSA